MDNQLNTLREKAQDYINLNQEVSRMGRSIFSAEKKKFKKMRKGQQFIKGYQQLKAYCNWNENDVFFDTLKQIILVKYSNSEDTPLFPGQTPEQYRLFLMERLEKQTGRELQWSSYSRMINKMMNQVGKLTASL